MALSKELLVKIGGRTKDLDRAATRSQALIRRIGTTAKNVTRNVGRIAIAAGAAAFAMKRAFVDPAAKQEEAAASLRQALASTGKVGEAAFRAIADEAARLQRITKAGDEALIEASTTLATLAPSLNADELMRAQTALVAISDTFTKGDLNNAASLLGKTLGSTTNALTRYGIQVDTSGTASEKLAGILGNAVIGTAFDVAQAKAQTLTGRLVQLDNAVGDLREQLGFVIVETLALTSGAGDLTNSFLDMADTLKENRATWVAWGKVVLASIRFAAQSFKTLVRVAFNVGEMIGRAMDIAASLLIGAFVEAFNTIKKDANHLIESLNRIPFIDIGFRFAIADTNIFFDNAKRQSAALLADIGDIGDSVRNLAGSWLRVQAAAEDARIAQGTSGTAFVPILSAPPIPMPAPPPRLPGAAVQFGRAHVFRDIISTEQSQRLKGVEDRMRTMGAVTEKVMDEMTAASQRWIDGFATGIADFVTTGKIQFKQFAKSVIHDLVRIAAKMAIFRVLGAVFPGLNLATVAGIAGKAGGGAVRGGRPYMVGERGRELFVPSGSGSIVPNHRLGASFSVDLSRMPVAANPLDGARDSMWVKFIAETLQEWERNGGRLVGA